jgi:hypothetical protein
VGVTYWLHSPSLDWISFSFSVRPYQKPA